MNLKNLMILGLSSILMMICVSCSKPSATKMWSTEDKLKVPESVMYDKVNDIIYVANINGKPTVKDGNGFISKMSKDGKILDLKWIEGMSAPKGMGIYKNMLYVTDIDRIHKIDIVKSKIVKTVVVAGAKFLNDIAIDGVGNVYITDMLGKKLNILKSDSVSLWLDLGKYNKPNGLYMEKYDIMVGTAVGLLKINLKSKAVAMEIPHKGGIDGLKSDGKGSYIVSDWKGKVQLINKSKKPVVLNDTSKDKINAADLEYIAKDKMILIPTFFNNRVVAYKLKN